MLPKLIDPREWYSSLPLPTDPWEEQRVFGLISFFRSMTVVFFLSLVVGPFIWINVTAAMSALVSMYVMLVLIPAALLRRGKDKAARQVFAFCLAFLWQTVVTLSGGVRSPIAAGLLISTLTFGILIGRMAAIWVAGFSLLLNLALTVFSLRGGHIPIIFPIPPLAAWYMQFVVVVPGLPLLLSAVARLRDSALETAHELERQKESRRQIQFQAELLDQAPDPILAVDSSHNVTYWNLAAAQKFQLPREWAVGNNLFSLLKTESDPEWIAACQAAERDGFWVGEVGLDVAGKQLRLEAVVKVIEDSSPQPYRIIGFRDVTEARQAASALRDSEERLRLFTDAAPVGIYVLDRHNNITFANHFFRRREARSGANFEHDLKAGTLDVRDSAGVPIPPSQFPSQRVFRSGMPVHNERLRLSRAGEVAYFSLSAAPICRDGDVTEVILAVDDITQKVSLEEQYLQAQKMESIGLLAGGVAHDFNNLLLVINGSCERMLDQTLPDDPRRKDILNTLTAGRRAADLTHQLLAVGKKASGIPETFCFNRLLQDFQPLLRRILRENILLTTSFPPQDCWITADRAQLHQIVMNLVINSQEAMLDGGELHVTLNHVFHPEDPYPGNWVVLSVKDTGIGMSPETRARIFEPFFSTKDSDRNVGLGLSSVYGIVKQAGGWMQVESEPGAGSIFRLYFPSALPLESVTVDPRPEKVGFPYTVLVVEDRHDVREFLATAMEAEGMHVLQASNGAEALLLAETCGRIDLLLTDMIMPGISGKETALRLVALRPEMQVILMTGYSHELMDRRNPLSPAFTVLRKPFTQPALRAAISESMLKVPAIE